MNTLEQFKAKYTGLRSNSMLTYNNKFIRDGEYISTKELYSPFKDILLELRSLYDMYLKETTVNKYNEIITHYIVGTEVICNMLYFNGWSVERLLDDDDEFFSIYVDVICENNSLEYVYNRCKTDRLKQIIISIYDRLHKLKTLCEHLICQPNIRLK